MWLIWRLVINPRMIKEVYRGLVDEKIFDEMGDDGMDDDADRGLVVSDTAPERCGERLIEMIRNDLELLYEEFLRTEGNAEAFMSLVASITAKNGEDEG